jgi:hypothetical protein
VIIANFNIRSVTLGELEADSPLVVNTNTPLTCTVAFSRSRRLPGGTRNSVTSTTRLSIASLRMATFSKFLNRAIRFPSSNIALVSAQRNDVMVIAASDVNVSRY